MLPLATHHNVGKIKYYKQANVYAKMTQLKCPLICANLATHPLTSLVKYAPRAPKTAWNAPPLLIASNAWTSTPST